MHGRAKLRVTAVKKQEMDQPHFLGAVLRCALNMVLFALWRTHARTHPMHFSSEWGDPLDRFARLPFHAQSPLHPLLASDDPLVMFSNEEDFPKGDLKTGIMYFYFSP